MPARDDEPYQFRIVAREADGYGGGRWGNQEAVIQLDDEYGRHGNEWYDWLYIGDEVLRNMHRAIGAYLAGKRVRGGG